jgi:hypothetical protein
MKRTIINIIFLVLPFILKSQDISVKAEYPAVVEAGQQFGVTWTVNEGGGEFAAPAFDGFYKLMGPETSYSSSTQIINGKISHQTSYSYVYYLQAGKEGKYVIAPAQFTLKGKVYLSDSIHIEVVGASSGTQSSQAAGNAAQGNSE